MQLVNNGKLLLNSTLAHFRFVNAHNFQTQHENRQVSFRLVGRMASKLS